MTYRPSRYFDGSCGAYRLILTALQIRLYRRRHDHNANLEAFWSLLAERFERTSTVFL